MRTTVKKFISYFLFISIIGSMLMLCSCQMEITEETSIRVWDLDVICEEEFGGAYIKISIDEFNSLGFTYGDSVNVIFSNGYKLEDIPYYNGYYTQNGEPLLVAYKGYQYIDACINNGDGLYAKAGLKEGDKAEISLFKQGKYKDIQNARDISYKDDRALFPSDTVFANFRSVKAGKIAENTLYRSASPCDNQHNRASYVDKLISEVNVGFILDLADNDEKINNYMSGDDWNSPYFRSLYESGNVVPLSLNMNFSSDDFRKKVADGLAKMAESDGPYLVHCTEGKDRTGFVCLLIVALCGASYQEIVDDYMITYDNYYSINKESDKIRYDVIIENVLYPMIKSITDDDNIDIKTADLSVYAEKFLKKAGMSEEKIDLLKNKLGKKK